LGRIFDLNLSWTISALFSLKFELASFLYEHYPNLIMKTSSLIGFLVGGALILTGTGLGIWLIVENTGINYVTYGTLTTYEEFPTEYSNPDVYVDFDGITASLFLISDVMSSDNLVEIENTVRGPKDLEEQYPSEANYWNITEGLNGSYYLEYIIANPSEVDYRFNHDIYMQIDYRANLFLDLEVTTGDIAVITEQANTNVDIESITCTTGSIEVNFADATQVTGSGLISAVTGNIAFFCDQDVLLDLDIFAITATTGSIYIEFHQNTILNSSNFLVSVITGDIQIAFSNSVLVNVSTFSVAAVTGSINFDFDEVLFKDGLNFVIGTTTGSIDLYWTQVSILTDHTFTIDIGTGDIDLILNLNSDIGTLFTASVGTGSIDIPADSISQGGMGQLTFILDIGTGDFDAIR